MPRPALIALDRQMPVVSGWTFLQQRAADREVSRIPVVVVIGVETEQQPDIVPVLQKPLGLQQLHPFLRRYCGLENWGLVRTRLRSMAPRDFIFIGSSTVLGCAED